MANNAENVTVGKPRTGGAIFFAPVGTTLPNDAATDLAATYKNLGYVSEDGVENDVGVDSTEVKAWGGETVMTTQNSTTDTFKFAAIEYTNIDAAKLFFGEDNVSGTLETGVTIKHNNNDLGEHVIVIEMILRGDVLQRIVIPRGRITTRETIVYKDDELVSLGVTVNGLQNSAGDTSYTYIKKAAVDGGGEG